MLCYSVASSHKNKFSILKSNHLYYLVEKFLVCTVSALSSSPVHFFHSSWASLQLSFPQAWQETTGPIFIKSLPSKKKIVLNVVPVKGTRMSFCTEILAEHEFLFLPILSFSPCMIKLIIALPTAQTLQHCKFSLSHTLGRQNEKEEQGQLLGYHFERSLKWIPECSMTEKNLTLYRQQISREL